MYDVLVFSVVQRALTDRTRHHSKAQPYSPKHASALLCPVFQDVINEAVGKASQEDEEAPGASKDDEDDGASDASSVLGLDGDAAPAPPKRRQSGKGPGSPARPSFGKAKPSKKGGNPPSSPAKVPLDQAQKALDLLKAVDAASVWKGALRDSDVNTRLKKMADALKLLEEASAACDGSPMQSKLTELIDAGNAAIAMVPKIQDVLGKLRSTKKVKALLEDQEFTDQMTDVISGPSMDPETFQSVMTTVASKAAAEAFEFPLQFLCVNG